MFIRRNRARSLLPSYFYRDDFLRKKARGLCACSTLLTPQCKCILVLA